MPTPLTLLGRVAGSALMRAALEEVKVEKPLDRLEEGLKIILSRFMELSAARVKVDGEEVLETKSTCPVHSIYPAWCEEACLAMAESMARQVDSRFKVERLERRPTSTHCVFRFRLSP